MKISVSPLLGGESSDRSRWASALRAAAPSSPRVLTFRVRACRQPSYSYVCGPLPRPLGATRLFRSQAAFLSPERRLTPSCWNSLRSRGSPASMSEPVLFFRASFDAARGKQLRVPNEESPERGGREAAYLGFPQ
jgi:hypothetical protein